MTPTEKQTIQVNCICATCGTSMEDNITGLCENEHDNWLELDDGEIYYQKVSMNLNISIDELQKRLLNLNK